MNQKNNNQFCTECGTELTGGKYCQECGTKIENNESTINGLAKKLLIMVGIIALIIIVCGIIGAIIEAGNYPDHAYQDNIDNTIHYNIPAGYKHIETKYISAGGQVLKTAIYKNKQGQEITVSKMSEGEMYIMGHGKKVPTNHITQNPDNSYGTLKQEGNFYLLVTSDDVNIIDRIK